MCFQNNAKNARLYGKGCCEANLLELSFVLQCGSGLKPCRAHQPFSVALYYFLLIKRVASVPFFWFNMCQSSFQIQISVPPLRTLRTFRTLRAASVNSKVSVPPCLQPLRYKNYRTFRCFSFLFFFTVQTTTGAVRDPITRVETKVFRMGW